MTLPGPSRRIIVQPLDVPAAPIEREPGLEPEPAPPPQRSPEREREPAPEREPSRERDPLPVP